jgi:prepilin-type N-terminal cleavage/methylation domain-containing protein/prepilin-type processing-associated H-X9-DG protein
MNRRAFTLIELLVVIAIIAILMAILMPSLRLAKDQAQRIHCISNTKTLVLGWLMYKDEYDGRIVPGHTDPGNWVDRPTYTGTWDEKKEAIRRGLLFPYVGETVDVYRCPADRRKESSSIPVAFRTFSIVGGANGEDWGDYDKCTLYSEILKPALKYIFVEEMDTRGANIGSWQMQPNARTWTDPLAMWHNKKSSLGFADGHAEMHTWEDQSFIEWNLEAMNYPTQFSFGMTPPGDERNDVEYMAKGFPQKPR